MAALILFLLAPPLGWLGVIATLACAYFFRDPERVTPQRPGLVVSSADGKVVTIGTVPAAKELALGDALLTRVSVFLSVLDVHVVRAPVAGRVVHSVYIPGKFLNAELDKASEENERRAMVIETAAGEKVGVVLIAGLIARRIVTFATEGASVAAGERIGLIRFGSRVDVYMPVGAEVLVAPVRRRSAARRSWPSFRVRALVNPWPSGEALVSCSLPSIPKATIASRAGGCSPVARFRPGC